MAISANIVKSASPQERNWHDVDAASVPASLLFRGQRRMEGETYLTSGYGIRRALEAKPHGWERFGNAAIVTTPPRIKQVLVSPENGTPYLNTSQVFEPIPSPRKWLALGKTNAANQRFVSEGTILVMASATVGRSIVATRQHENAIISHHFMRVTARDPQVSGWIYGFLRSPQGQAMMSSSQYASIIRHIEPAHLNALPIPNVSPAIAAKFQRWMDAIIDCRNQATRYRKDAEAAYETALGAPVPPKSQIGFTVSSTELTARRRRLEAAYHSPTARTILNAFARQQRLGDLVKRVWWQSRFKRAFGEAGMPYMSADDLFTTNPHQLKSILVEGKKDIDEFLVQKNWIVMACSGQIYGLNGSAMLTSEYHRGFFLSHDLIRIEPDPTKARPGYLLTALTHPTLGRPLVLREAYGMSIPHLDPDDVAGIAIPRLNDQKESAIADLAEKSAAKQAEAESQERDLAEAAGKVISEFLMRE
ncbi:MAG: hypothetical protein JJ913_03830 [Rhizobiaceae bacterium]|nr:hypothetical protein [Rhizobiaceae bacterium]